MEPKATWNKAFLIALMERVLASVIGGALAIFANDSGLPTTWDEWKPVLVGIGVGAAYSLVKGVAANLVTKTGPGLTNYEQTVPPAIDAPGERGLNEEDGSRRH